MIRHNQDMASLTVDYYGKYPKQKALHSPQGSSSSCQDVSDAIAKQRKQDVRGRTFG